MGSVTDEPLPHSLAIRQDVHVITQTLSREHTTFVTYVTLGGAAPTDSTQTTTATDHHQGPGGLTNAQIGAIVGSVVGVFVLAVLVVWCCCCQRRRPPPRDYNDRRSYSSYSSSYIVDEVVEVVEPSSPKSHKRRSRPPPTVLQPNPPPTGWPPRPPPVVERVPGGPKFPTYRAIPIPNPRRPKIPHVH